MGATNSKAETTEALRLCKDRKKYIKRAIYSRYNFAAAHIAYIQSLKNVGVALRRFAEAEVLIESSLSTSITEIDKTPSHYSSYLSPSPSHVAGVSDSPLPSESSISPPKSRLSYMKSGGTAAVTVRVSPSSNSSYVDDGESMAFPMPPPPPHFHELGSSWDYFDPTDDAERFTFMGHDRPTMNFDAMRMYGHDREIESDFDGISRNHEVPVTPDSGKKGHNLMPQSDQFSRAKSEASGICHTREEPDSVVKQLNNEKLVNGGTPSGKAALDLPATKNIKSKVEKGRGTEREDPSEFITHRAKDFLSSIKDIEHRFFRASESGREVSRMLEAYKIRIGYSETTGKSSAAAILETFKPNCCGGGTALVSHEPSQHVPKFITWKRSTSSRSFSSRNPLATPSKDENDDSGSEFAEEFCMIAGSHSSTLDRMYAWERKLYDEVKASECIRKEYDRRCDQLRHQFAKDLSAQVIDKTRFVIKDLHSRITVALHAVDSISKRIEKMRDEELQPQLIELIQGLIRMWKAMLECHHAQYITLSLAYHAKSSVGNPLGDAKREIMSELQHEIECFGLRFTDWVNSHTSYVEALNGWLQNCIMHPREKSKGRRPFSPRRALAPPIIVLGRDWSVGIKDLPSEELTDAIKALLSDLHYSARQAEELQKKETPLNSSVNGEAEEKEEEKSTDRSSNLSSVRTSLTKVLDRLTKFSEASLKLYEDIRQKSETAQNAYSSYKHPRSLNL